MKSEWHRWFAWYPVYSFELGWVWLRFLDRKQIPEDFVERARNKSNGARISESITGCWHRIQDEEP